MREEQPATVVLVVTVTVLALVTVGEAVVAFAVTLRNVARSTMSDVLKRRLGVSNVPSAANMRQMR